MPRCLLRGICILFLSTIEDTYNPMVHLPHLSDLRLAISEMPIDFFNLNKRNDTYYILANDVDFVV
jgi:hypothetical protein